MILKRIIEDKRKSLEELQLNIDDLKRRCETALPPKDFYSVLRREGISIIGEIKRASPSKGVIREDFPHVELAREYEGAVEAVSILTEEEHFKGSMKYLKDIAQEIDTPLLCKDFIFTREQIYLARANGASSILLIVRILEEELLKELLTCARSLGMEPLVETHTEGEVKKALEAGAMIVGINNRDLSNFTVDIRRSIELRRNIPEEVVVVAESGIKSRSHVALLEEAGIDAILVGETLMRSRDLVGTARELRGVTTKVKICGIKTPQEVEILNRCKPHYTGLVFAPSKRQVDRETSKELRERLHPSIKTVGVFVDEEYEEILNTARYCKLDVVQLHGREDTDLCRRLREVREFKVWKALPGETISDYIIENYSQVADYLLFDSITPGGGKTFHWERIKDVHGNIILAGGLAPYNVGEAVKKVRPSIVDVSSGVEGSEGKDYSKILRFIEEVRKYG
ncbi:tryptophan biosynthesis protein TrpCF [Propionigenium maris DSM 9537]|uniref:Multifunctional fusion protein n=1 Tax=Propionigenium maris DSM 9537 TaxID=1123000 RepID=A0A9W6LM45_9FUSO|nr:bifunctional indole-3-glycerol-phosphate synthase TrpC/phosphoribosylanthranilate isomerase TrpF [Propionigenium maris]GLI55951.1 tryptophan biosynthesis protein TrpCF [Propionigenium maris DSM 9537]